MNRILFLFIAAICCLTTNVWGVTEKTVTISCTGQGLVRDTESGSGIVVSGTIAYTGNSYWSVNSSKSLTVMPNSLIITKIVLNGDEYGTIDRCNNLDKKENNVWWQNGAYNTYSSIVFSSTSSSYTNVSSLTITYHKHGWEGCVIHHEAKEATCTEDGNVEYWECDCGMLFEDEVCTKELEGNLVIPSPGHKLTYNEPTDATCFEDGNVEYWHCSACDKNFSDADCTNEIAGSVVLPGGHRGMEHFAPVEPKCTEPGNKEYWHCTVCDNYYADSNYSEELTQAETVTSALGHELTHTAHQNATIYAEGTLSYWHCGRCGKNYQEETAVHEISGSTVLPRWEADALLIGNSVIDESYLFDTEAEVTFTDDAVNLAVGGEEYQYDLDEIEPIVIDFSHTFRLTANQDPDHTDDYYSTFYTSEGAYRLPADGTAKAYICLAEENIGMMTSVGGIIHKGEAVLLKASQNSILLMPSANVDAASGANIFEGTDEAMILGADQYAFSYGANGIGFYIWDGKEIGANKTYLTLDSEMPIVKFEYDDGDNGPTGIDNVNVNENVNDNVLYNLNGVRVGADYKGIVIKKGKKYYQK